MGVELWWKNIWPRLNIHASSPVDTGHSPGKLPSYIPAASFAQAVIDLAHSFANPGAGGVSGSIDRLRLALEGIPNAQLRDTLRDAIRLGGNDPEAVRKHLEAWYAGVMDRVSGWYRRQTQWWILGTSLAVAVLMNVNTVVIVKTLVLNDALRTAVAKNAELVAKDHRFQAAYAAPYNAAAASNGAGTSTLPDKAAAERAGAPFDAQVKAVGELGLPIGWEVRTRRQLVDLGQLGPSLPAVGRVQLGWIAVLIGWVMTALAISLGAPFWFDVLNKFMIVRSTVKPREKSKEEGSKDAKESGAKAAPPPPPAPAPPPPPDVLSPATAGQEEIAEIDPAERPREEI